MLSSQRLEREIEARKSLEEAKRHFEEESRQCQEELHRYLDQQKNNNYHQVIEKELSGSSIDCHIRNILGNHGNQPATRQKNWHSFMKRLDMRNRDTLVEKLRRCYNPPAWKQIWLTIFKEHDKLMRNIANFNDERKMYEQQVKDGIGKDGQTGTLRKKFRQLMATVKAEHEQAFEKEMEKHHQVERKFYRHRTM
ncbi:hypothetical protein BJV82DRAFT_666013 [Fennellomyces sp. T-0311]|nr:hypothetical protein BJV82DRAFT_666013 [Fennellomyces sp. T-0311]